MDTQRLILFVVFSFSILMLWDAWQKEHRPQPAPTVQGAPAGQPAGSVPAPTTAAPAAGAPTTPSGAIPQTPAVAAEAAGKRQPITVRTDTFAAEIDPIGGEITRLELLQHKDPIDQNKNLMLLSPEHRYAVQSGLIGPGLPNHKTLYTATANAFTLVPGQDKLEVRLEAPGPDGVKTAKVLTFHRGSYIVDVAHEIRNASQVPVPVQGYFHLTRDDKSPPGDSAMLQTYTGAAVYTDSGKYQKVGFSDIEKGKVSYPKTANDGWVAMVQHYFVSALVPAVNAARENYSEKIGEGLYRIGVKIAAEPVAPGATATVATRLYAGPQEQESLKQLAPGLDLVVDYGWLTIIAVPLFWLLKFFYGWLGNWGLAIIALTVLIKLVFFPLSAASYKSMARMRVVTPRLMKLREQYGNDRAKLNQAMMELYKSEKINPLGGCLPIVVQIPVFIALYWTLLGSVELRHAPFYGWIKDLSAPDPFFVLPALMMGSMIIQTKMNPTPPDPVQAKVMMIMPFAFGVMFFFFPAGLVLYWLVNNILSIAQQWQITRMIEGQKGAAAGAKS